MHEPKMKVIPPTNGTILPVIVPVISGASLIIRKTPAFTMVLECRSADVGVGATIAPRSHDENGS